MFPEEPIEDPMDEPMPEPMDDPEPKPEELPESPLELPMVRLPNIPELLDPLDCAQAEPAFAIMPSKSSHKSLKFHRMSLLLIITRSVSEGTNLLLASASNSVLYRAQPSLTDLRVKH
jgi:hypothetical protein